MTYFLFFLALGLITALTVAVRQLQQQKRTIAIERQKRKEAERIAESHNRVRNELTGQNDQLNREIQTLQNQKEDAIAQVQQRSKQLTDDLIERDQLIDQLKHQVEALRQEQLELKANKLNRNNGAEAVHESVESNEEKIQEYESVLEDYKREIKALKSENHKLTLKNKHQQFNKVASGPSDIELNATEVDLYPQERVGILIETLSHSLETHIQKNTRREHIISDIIASNNSNIAEYRSRQEHLRAEIKQLFRSYKRMNSGVEQSLKQMGFEIVSDKKHYKIIFCRDSRYGYTFAKTSSDHRSGQNAATDICKLFM